MSGVKQYIKPFIFFFTTVCMALSVSSPSIAGIVTTAELVDAQQIQLDRDHIQQLLAREDVKLALKTRGVDTLAAQERVASLTNSEIQTMLADIDQLPAGGRVSTLELLLIILIIIILV